MGYVALEAAELVVLEAAAPNKALVEACRGLLAYWTRNINNFQWEKADDHVKRINAALGGTGT